MYAITSPGIYDLESMKVIDTPQPALIRLSDRRQEPNDSNRQRNSLSQKQELINKDMPLQLVTVQSGSAPLPNKKGNRAYRYLRWNFESVYSGIFSVVFLANAVAVAVVVVRMATGGPQLTYGQASDAVAANLFAALVVRNEHVVNVLFIVFGTWPRCFPLTLRRLFAKIYSYGGIHSGSSIAATFWYFAFLTQLTRSYVSQVLNPYRCYIFLVSYSIVFLLVTIITFAHPRLRVIMHNWFEGIHRFLGWTVIILFWVQVMLVAADTVHDGAATLSSQPTTSFCKSLSTNATFWMLIFITLLVVYPWARLRLRKVEIEPLSDHCVKLLFSYCNAHYGQAVRLSDAPLKETHAFATIPSLVVSSDLESAPPAREGLSCARTRGFSVVISDAGDWTRKIIRNPPDRIFTRGVPQYGVLRIAGMFEPVIIIATGSGIAPCLSLFVEKPDHPVRIIWSAPRPLETFGQGIIDTVYKSDPDAIIIDTRKNGRPDLAKIAYGVWKGSRTESQSDQQSSSRKAFGPCEAVVIISNQKVTRKVVYGLESRGVPTYGALFDS
ncbi:gramicidin s synthetase 1 [Grosmannia clavigera kw1407]|uniref:Gramicidin s synthetase 1 n=1 Tax=Grosmannia clavigera (strain kw1407 / UAMH 11150) TaxID=655863 RepID=F0XE26_GROCL|nr:gramicidin s synthetase 1 [Grosmannia clavigera kw1407]EFX03727.1 gramicidin s synthetase 1 [Grosmannia clavigera kw1407]